MPIIAVECIHCGARLKVKAGAGRTPPAIKCPKCGKQIALTRKTDAPAPSAPTPAADQAPVAPPPLPTEEEQAPPPAADACDDEPPEEEPPQPPPLPVAEPPEPADALAPVQDSEEEVAPPPMPEPEAESEFEPEPEPEPVPQAPAPRRAAAPIVITSLGDHPTAAWVNVHCASCKWQSTVREELIGKKIRCKQCGTVIEVAARPESPRPAPVVEAAVPATSEPAPAPARPPTIRLATSPLPPAAPPSDAVPSRAQIAELQGRLVAAERRLAEADRRAAEADARVDELRRLVGEMASDYESELSLIEERMTVLHQNHSRLSKI